MSPEHEQPLQFGLKRVKGRVQSLTRQLRVGTFVECSTGVRTTLMSVLRHNRARTWPVLLNIKHSAHLASSAVNIFSLIVKSLHTLSVTEFRLVLLIADYPD